MYQHYNLVSNYTHISIPELNIPVIESCDYSNKLDACYSVPFIPQTGLHSFTSDPQVQFLKNEKLPVLLKNALNQRLNEHERRLEKLNLFEYQQESMN